ncbi:MAG TPA: hypothetical protein VM755_05165 [Stellaceae bacterium]|nr:hypothetical protein [Stellaceae bacterium]
MQDSDANLTTEAGSTDPAVRRNISVRELVGSAQDAASQAADAQGKSKIHLYDALQIMLEISELLENDPGARESLTEAYKEREIRADDRRIKNRFVPLAKLIFAGHEKKPANISRNAAAVKYAAENGIRSENLMAWIEEQGGVARCSSLEAAARRKAGVKRESKAVKILHELLAKRRQKATAIQPVAGIKLHRGAKLFSILFELDEAGNYAPLGSNAENEQTIRRYLADELPKRKKASRKVS